jgi:hypothetical protein
MFYFLPALQAGQRCQVYKAFLIAIKEHWEDFGVGGMSKQAESCFSGCGLGIDNPPVTPQSKGSSEMSVSRSYGWRGFGFEATLMHVVTVQLLAFNRSTV